MNLLSNLLKIQDSSDWLRNNRRNNMSEDNNSIDTSKDEPKDDPIKNLKSEFSRKQENVMSELAELKNLIMQSKAPVQQQQNQKAKPDPVIDPEGYEQYIMERATAQIDSKISSQNQRQQQLSTLVQQFPELQDGNSELTKKAVDYYNKLSPEEKMSPNAYKYAVQDAALDIGVVPMSKRKQFSEEDESFTGSSSNNTKRPSQKNKSQADDKLDPATLAFAQAIGKDINDPKYLESLKKSASRKNWSKNQ